jgi:hypothetical protein
MDYRTLLVKYMELILVEEGVSYINSASPTDFSGEEIEELKKIEKEVTT